MNKRWKLIAAGLATAAVLAASWQLAGSSPGGVRAQASLERGGGGVAVGISSTASLADGSAELDSSRAAGSGASAAQVGTTILVIDARSEQPIERFALRIWKGGDEFLHYPSPLVEAPLKEVPGGALVVATALEGFDFSVYAPGYLPCRGELRPASAGDRRAFVRLERGPRVRGRAMFEGEPLEDAEVRVTVAKREKPASSRRKRVTRTVRTDGRGAFELLDLPVGSARISIRATKGRGLEQSLGELAPGAQLELGELELGRDSAAQQRRSSETVYELARDMLAELEENPGAFDSVAASEALTEVTSSGSWSLFGEEVEPVEAGHVRVQAFEGERPLSGLAVLTQLVGSTTAQKVGSTDAAGELLFALEPGIPTDIVLRTAGEIPLGHSQVPVTLAPGQELAVPVVLELGRLTLEFPVTFAAGPDTGLLLQLQSDALPEPGYTLLTLRGEPAEFALPGLLWTGAGCEFPSLAAGDYRITADLLRKAREGGGSRLQPIGERFAGEVRVLAGGEVSCVLALE